MRTFTFAVLSLAAVASAANIGRRQSQPPAFATQQTLRVCAPR
ncbi:hypothetical protein PIIN_11617 [Serendipita indica DSM 11827]|uniref:Uncharacterized protein n=1 Tax=Serendipita indica (strain DSM 11827) TaxID=1109443 RepID=G4U246_SERID|nr:hypothetical protein PIIN_11617 [Serendipita indica DSM 11827]